MASITSAFSLRAGKKAKDQQGSDLHLSKVVELNGQYRLYFRTAVVDPDENIKDIVAAVVPGRSLDWDVCGASYISYDKNMLEVSDSGKFSDKSSLPSWERIARVIHQAQCTREKKNKENEAKRTAEELGVPIDQVSLAKAIEGIELQYNGGKAADGTSIAPKKRPAISSLQQKMTTQVLVVKLNPDGSPDFENSQYATLEISNAKMNELISLSDKPEYCRPDRDYFEVGYDYIGKDKPEAGRGAKFQGIASNLSLESVYPEQWTRFGKTKVDGLAMADSIEDIAEIMKSRNRNLTGTATPDDIIMSLKKWCANNAAVFGSIDYEDANTARAAQDLIDSNLLDAIPVVKQKLEALVAEENKNKETPKETAEQVVKAEEVEQESMKQASAVLDAGEAAQTLAQLTNAVPNIDLGDEDDGDISDL